jgi:hypothetical protein
LPTVQLPKELQVEILHDFAETLNMHWNCIKMGPNWHLSYLLFACSYCLQELDSTWMSCKSRVRDV